jgi:hypothetical protein
MGGRIAAYFLSRDERHQGLSDTVPADLRALRAFVMKNLILCELCVLCSVRRT